MPSPTPSTDPLGEHFEKLRAELRVDGAEDAVRSLLIMRSHVLDKLFDLEDVVTPPRKLSRTECAEVGSLMVDMRRLLGVRDDGAHHAGT
jgi:hypothetical protein